MKQKTTKANDAFGAATTKPKAKTMKSAPDIGEALDKIAEVEAQARKPKPKAKQESSGCGCGW